MSKVLQEFVKGTLQENFEKKKKKKKNVTVTCTVCYAHNRTDDDAMCDHGLTRGTGFGSPQDKETDGSPVVLHFWQVAL